MSGMSVYTDGEQALVATLRPGYGLGVHPLQTKTGETTKVGCTYMSVNTDDAEISMSPTDIKFLIFRWANDHLSDIISESKRRNMTATDFIILMLDDGLEAWQNSEVFAE